ncbi:hypothetical protein VIGAN_04156900, partial [Vigna angularis var. angularis]
FEVILYNNEKKFTVAFLDRVNLLSWIGQFSTCVISLEDCYAMYALKLGSCLADLTFCRINMEFWRSFFDLVLL